MSISEWPNADKLNQINDSWESYYNDPANRNEKTHLFLGVKIVRGPVHPFGAFKVGAGRHIEIPKNPTFLQKLVSFFLIQSFFAEFVRRENQYSGYVFRWNKAREIFSW